MFGHYKARHHRKHKRLHKHLKHGGFHFHHGRSHFSGRAKNDGIDNEFNDTFEISDEYKVKTVEHRAGNTHLNHITATCPLCKNHCSLAEPGCGKGATYAQSRTDK